MTEPSLFRYEALEFQRHNRQWGEVALRQPPSAALTTWLIAIVVVLLGVLLSVTQYARKETVRGYLAPAAGTAKVFPARPGTITAVHVEKGAVVREGQDLLTIGTGQTAADGRDVDQALLDTLKAHRAELRAQVASQEERKRSERLRLEAAVQSLQTEIDHLNEQTSIQKERIRIAQASVGTAALLSGRGLMSELESRRRQEEHLSLLQQLQSLNQQIAARGNDLVEARSKLDQLPVTSAERTQELVNELSTIEQRIVEIEGRRAYVIRAPRDGRVATLEAHVGQAVDPQRMVLEILPVDSTLQAELLVPTRAIGFVRAGQKARILYDAFPYQSFGAYGGRVADVSQTILTAGDLVAPVEMKEPCYRVTVRLDRPDVDIRGKVVPLQAGMLLRADIILNRRPLIAWLLDPLREARL